MNTRQAKTSFHRFTWKWLTLFAVLIAGLFWVMLTTIKPEAHIPYGDFVEQVQAGNVMHIQISDTEVTGSFSSPILWSSESNASTADQSSIYPAMRYTNFRTARPRTLGASSLELLLEEYGIRISAARPPMPWFIAALRYAFPLALLLTVGVWIARQFSFVPQRPLVDRGQSTV